MASKKSGTRSAKPPAKPQLQNLAARPAFEDSIDEQMVDHSGVFRVTSSIRQAQTGHDEEHGMRFPNDSLVMAAQRAGFPDDGPTIDETVDEQHLEDEAANAAKRQRLATLAARSAALANANKRRR
jgi:hypothetical protein